MTDNVAFLFFDRLPRKEIDARLAEFGLGANPYLLRRRVEREVFRLHALSDADLSRQGLSRDAIVRHVCDTVVAAG